MFSPNSRYIAQNLAARQNAQASLAKLRVYRDDALFHGSQYTGQDVRADLLATRRAAIDGLRLFGLDDQKQAKPVWNPVYFSDGEKEAIIKSCYELLLVLADAVSRPASDAENPTEQATKALITLDHAAAPLRSCHAGLALAKGRVSCAKRQA